MSRAVERVGFNAGSSTAQNPQISGVTPPRPFDLALVTIYLQSATAEVTAVELGAGTFTRVGRQVGATTSIELWEGHGFAEGETDATLNVTMTAATNSVLHLAYFRSGAVQGAPTVVSTASATGATGPIVAGDLTPTLDDETQLLYYVSGHDGATDPVWTHTPGGMETYAVVETSNFGAAYGSMWTARRTPNSLVAHGLSGTTTVEWVAIQALITPTAPVAHTDNHIYKGRLTSTLDNAAVA